MDYPFSSKVTSNQDTFVGAAFHSDSSWKRGSFYELPSWNSPKWYNFQKNAPQLEIVTSKNAANRGFHGVANFNVGRDIHNYVILLCLQYIVTIVSWVVLVFLYQNIICSKFLCICHSFRYVKGKAKRSENGKY